MADGIGILIDDVIFKVFSFLSLKDRGQAARVCQRWNNLMKDSILWTWVSLWPLGDYSAFPSRLSRSFMSLAPQVWEFPREEEAALTFLTTYCGVSLQTIYLNIVSPGILGFLRENCPNLKHLSYLPPTKHSFSTPLPSFTMGMGNELSNDMSFISHGITNIQLTFHGRQIHKKKPAKQSKLTWKQKRARVSILTIPDARLTNALFSHLSGCTNLRHISLYHCSGVSVAAVAQLTKSIPKLQTLHLMHFDYDYNRDTNVLEDILFLIGENLVVLESFRYMPMIRRAADLDDFLSIISCRSSIKNLWLPGPMLFFSPPAFANIAKGLTNLHELALCQSASVTNTIVKMISNYMLQLQVLNLRGCNSITDEGVRYLCHNHTLRYLDLRECKRTTTEAVLETILSMLEIVHVDVSSHLNKKREFLTRIEDIKKGKPNLKISMDFTYSESENN
ncbi:uncharacterized protein [Amphiura filiformis]|uniref:uncharacterized protein n=1 Tax=Amphiura filiformis TaxID=82378 RepID=UPI003B224BC3